MVHYVGLVYCVLTCTAASVHHALPPLSLLLIVHTSLPNVQPRSRPAPHYRPHHHRHRHRPRNTLGATYSVMEKTSVRAEKRVQLDVMMSSDFGSWFLGSFNTWSGVSDAEETGQITRASCSECALSWRVHGEGGITTPLLPSIF